MSVIVFDEEKLEGVSPRERGLLKALYPSVGVDHSTWVKQRFDKTGDCDCCHGGSEYIADLKDGRGYLVVSIEDAFN